MDIMNAITSGENVIMNDKYNCLLSPSIKCDDTINYLSYSSKIFSSEDNYKDYMTKYNEDLAIDTNNNYLIELPNKYCNINSDKIKKCSQLNIEEYNNIKNIITEESYSLENYINKPELLREFIINEPNFLKILLYEFKNLFKGLTFLSEKNVVHHNITPKNIIFNQQTKKMKFVNFGKRENKFNLINSFKKNKFNKYQLQIYYPFICFFMNYQNYTMYKNLTHEEETDFINFLENIFFDITYTPMIYNNNVILKEQFKNIDNIEEFKKYKLYIKSNQNINFFKITLKSFRHNYLKKQKSYSFFVQHVIDGIDIYGLSLTTLHFFKILKDKYSINKSVYDTLSSCLSYLTSNLPIPDITRTYIAEKAFFYFRLNYYFILDLLKKKKEINDINNLQYKLRHKDIVIYHGIVNNNYINHNGKLMRTFKYDSIFTYLNNLSSYNHSLIKKIIDDDRNHDKLNILIDKDAYYKIKYNLYCTDDKEMNPYSKKCVSKCKKDYHRNLNNLNFNCTKKNVNNSQKNINKSEKNINKSEKNKNKSQKNKNKSQHKKCPSGYERNPFTKACTKKCLSGYIRNLKFNCISEKDVL